MVCVSLKREVAANVVHRMHLADTVHEVLHPHRVDLPETELILPRQPPHWCESDALDQSKPTQGEEGPQFCPMNVHTKNIGQYFECRSRLFHTSIQGIVAPCVSWKKALQVGGIISSLVLHILQNFAAPLWSEVGSTHGNARPMQHVLLRVHLRRKAHYNAQSSQRIIQTQKLGNHGIQMKQHGIAYIFLGGSYPLM